MSAAAGGMITPAYAYASNNPIAFIDPTGLETGIFVDGLPSGGQWGFFSGIGDALASATVGEFGMGQLYRDSHTRLTPAFNGTNSELLAAGMRAILENQVIRQILIEIAGHIYSSGALQFAVGALLTDPRSAQYMLDLIAEGMPPMQVQGWANTTGGKTHRGADNKPIKIEVYRHHASWVETTTDGSGPHMFLPFVSRAAHELGHASAPAAGPESNRRALIFETVLQEAFGFGTRNVHID